jgi:hypothetical protein
MPCSSLAYAMPRGIPSDLPWWESIRREMVEKSARQFAFHVECQINLRIKEGSWNLFDINEFISHLYSETSTRQENPVELSVNE